MKTFLFLFIFFISSFDVAFGYIGPGMVGVVLAAMIGILVAIFAAFFGLLWFPIKRILKKRKNKNDEEKSIDDKNSN